LKSRTWTVARPMALMPMMRTPSTAKWPDH
jgi:hypothetical protein